MANTTLIANAKPGSTQIRVAVGPPGSNPPLYGTFSIQGETRTFVTENLHQSGAAWNFSPPLLGGAPVRRHTRTAYAAGTVVVYTQP